MKAPIHALIAALAVALVAAPALAQQGGPRGQRGGGPQGPNAQHPPQMQQPLHARRGDGPPPAERAAQKGVLQATGNGQVMVTPDIAIVTIGVVTRAATASAALADNSQNLNAALAAIKAAGVADKDVGTSGFSINPVYQPLRDAGPDAGPPKIVGYTVSNNVRVTIRDIATSGDLLDHVTQAGANQVNGIAFDVADRASAEDAAIKAAIGEAKRRGALMAAAAGVKLGKMLSVHASTGGGGPSPVFARMEAAAPTPVMPGQQAVTANASISWEIVEK